MAAKRSRSTDNDDSFNNESLESRSRSTSPEIGYVGSPAVFKLYEKNGQAFVIKKPIDIEKKRESSKKLDESSIASLLSSSDSDSELNIDDIKKKGAKIVARSNIDQDGFELLDNTPSKDEKLIKDLKIEDSSSQRREIIKRDLFLSLKKD